MRLCVRLLSSRTKQLVDHYSQFHPSILTIQQFIDFGTKDASARRSFLFLRNELPVRLSNILREFDLLPESLVNQATVKLVRKWYEQSSLDLVDFVNSSGDDEDTQERFNLALIETRERHSRVVETMAGGVMQVKEGSVLSVEEGGRVQYFLDRFYMNRISIRMLVNQHLILFGDGDKPVKHIGCIDPYCDVLSVAQDAYENARFLCDQYYSIPAPKCCFESISLVDARTGPAREEGKILLTYVPSHLYHMMFELFKNALRAVVEWHKDSTVVPELKVLICKGSEDVTIKISDKGGGIRRSELPLLFNYMYSTAPTPTSQQAQYLTPLAGYGYGLPLSRLYARYLHGDLWLNSVDGYGTDAMICLKLQRTEASEYLPVFNTTSTNKYSESTQVDDWTDNKP